MGTEKLIRYRISVPKEDVSITQWMDCQANISHSIRAIIRTYIQNYGYTDATCQPVIQHPNSDMNLSNFMNQNSKKFEEPVTATIQPEAEEPVTATIQPEAEEPMTATIQPEVEESSSNSKVLNQVQQNQDVTLDGILNLD